MMTPQTLCVLLSQGGREAWLGTPTLAFFCSFCHLQAALEANSIFFNPFDSHMESQNQRGALTSLRSHSS